LASVSIVNVVCLVKFTKNGKEAPLDFGLLESALPGSYGVPGGLVYRHERPRASFLFRGSGSARSAIVLGAKSLRAASEASRKVLELLRRAGADVDGVSVYVHNIVAVAKLEWVNLDMVFEALASRPGLKVLYEPEVFPGLVVKSTWYTALVFSSGKAVILGVKREDDATAAARELEEHLRSAVAAGHIKSPAPSLW